MSGIDLQRSDPGRIVNCRVLEAPDPVAIPRLQAHKLHVYLDMMARDLLGVPVGMDSSSAHLLRKTRKTVLDQRPIDTRA